MAGRVTPSSHLRSPPLPEAPKESVVSRLLIAPLTFISFLISLALIDSRNHTLRAHAHTQPSLRPTTTVGRVKAWFHNLVYSPVELSPYAYVKSPDAKGTEVKVVMVDGKEKESEPWHWHTKQRKMMKAEVVDAFQMRKRVVFVLGVGVLGLVMGTWWSVRWIWGLLGVKFGGRL